MTITAIVMATVGIGGGRRRRRLGCLLGESFDSRGIRGGLGGGSLGSGLARRGVEVRLQFP